MHEKLLILAGLLMALIMTGCLSSSQEGGLNETSNITGQGQNDAGAEEVVLPFTAQAGLQNATSEITKLRPDSVLMQVYGDCDSDGKSTEWQYSFNSKEAMTGYVISMPHPERGVRNTQFSVRRGIPSGWVDGTSAASKCGHGGQCTLEMSGDSPVWTIISDTDTCTINALSNARVD
jgi:hypothetical protein